MKKCFKLSIDTMDDKSIIIHRNVLIAAIREAGLWRAVKSGEGDVCLYIPRMSIEVNDSGSFDPLSEFKDRVYYFMRKCKYEIIHDADIKYWVIKPNTFDSERSTVVGRPMIFTVY